LPRLHASIREELTANFRYVTHDWKMDDIGRQACVTEHSDRIVWVGDVLCKMYCDQIGGCHIVVIKKNDKWTARGENTQILGLGEPAVLLSEYPQRHAFGIAVQ